MGKNYYKFMVNPYTIIIFSLVLAIATLSPAQIRYAVENPMGSLNVFLNLGIILAFIVVYFMYRRSKENTPVDNDYSLIGSKGGRATKTKKTSRRKTHKV